MLGRVAATTTDDEASDRVRKALDANRFRGWALLGRLDGVLIATVAFGAGLRFWGLGAQSLWYDEWLTLEAVSGGIGDLLRHVETREGIPAPYFALLWGWARLFGEGEVALRFVSALAGTATIPVVYAVGRELVRGRAVARAAALIVTVNPMFVWYSQEARPYAALAFMGALSFLAFARAYRRGRYHDLILWALACAGALGIHYFAVFLVVAEAGALLLVRGRQRRQVLAACVPSAFVLAILAPVAIEQYSHEGNRLWISGFRLTDRQSEAVRSALVGPSVPNGRLWLVAAAVVALAALLLLAPTIGRTHGAAGLAAGIGATAVLLPVAATMFGVDVVLSRYLIASLVPLMIAVAIGLVGAASPRIGGVALILLGSVSIGAVIAVARDASLQRSEWRAVAHAVDASEGGGRLLFLNVHGAMASPLFHYLDGVRVLGDDEAFTAEEINVLSVKPSTNPCNFFVGQPCALVFLGGPLPPSVADQLTLQEQIELDQFTVNRYKPAHRLSVTKADLVLPSDLPDGIVLVVDE
jgi:uncharacterized membrane protein